MATATKAAAAPRTRTTTGKARTTEAAPTAAPKAVPRRPKSASVRRKVTVLTPPRLVEDDLEVLASEHAARDAELLDLVARLVA